MGRASFAMHLALHLSVLLDLLHFLHLFLHVLQFSLHNALSFPLLRLQLEYLVHSLHQLSHGHLLRTHTFIAAVENGDRGFLIFEWCIGFGCLKDKWLFDGRLVAQFYLGVHVHKCFWS